MNVERYLELLNKAPRTPDEEAELQTELKRQAAEKTGQAEPAIVPGVYAVKNGAEDSPVESSTPEPAQEETVAEPESPVEAAPAEVDNVPYTLELLDNELQDAIGFVGTHNQTLAVEMAKAALISASYWIRLAKEGK